MKVLATMILSLALIGCGVTPHEVSVNFADRSAYTSASVVGIPVHVTVADDRDSELVGQRNAIGAKIKATNLLSHLRTAVKELFEAKGYRLVTESQALRRRFCETPWGVLRVHNGVLDRRTTHFRNARRAG